MTDVVLNNLNFLMFKPFVPSCEYKKLMLKKEKSRLVDKKINAIIFIK
jgi:hypothetical protein